MFKRLKVLKVRWGVWALVVFYVYLTLHVLSGKQGFVRWDEAKDQVAERTVILDRLVSERKSLEVKTERLQASGLHLDNLGRIAREKLFLSHPNEIVIFLEVETKLGH